MATLRLDDIVLEQMQTNETLERVETKVVGLLQSIDRNIDNFIVLWFSNKMREMEQMRERVSGQSDTDGDGIIPEKEKSQAEGLGFGLFGFAAAITGSFLGFATGIADILGKLMPEIQAAIQSGWTKFINGFKAMFSAEGIIGKGIDKIKDGLKPISNFFTKMGTFFGTEGVVSKTFSKIGSFFEPIKGFVKSFGVTFSKFFSFFRVLGRFFLPITAAIEVFSSLFKEFSAMTENADWVDKLTGALKGALKGLANIVLIPLDLVKSAISWVADKMGFENFANLLDSFSYSDIFSKIVDTIFNFLEGVGRGLFAGVKALFTGGDVGKEFKKGFSSGMSGGEGQPEQSTPEISSSGVTSAQMRGANRVMSRGQRSDQIVNSIPSAIESSVVASSDQANATSGSIAEREYRVEKNLTKMSDITTRMVGGATRGLLGDKIAEGSAVSSPMVNVINTSNVSSPSSTVNQNISGPSMLPSPVINNGSRADAYSIG